MFLSYDVSLLLFPSIEIASVSLKVQYKSNLHFFRYETQRSRLVSDPSQKILIDYGTDDPLVQSHSSPQHGGHGTDRVDGGGSGGHHAHTHHHMPGMQINSLKRFSVEIEVILCMVLLTFRVKGRI